MAAADTTFFESEDSDLANAGKSWSYSTPSAGVQRFEVRGGDYYDNPNTGPAEDDQAEGKNRSEVVSQKHMQNGRLFTVEFDFMVESGAANTADWLILAQFHQTSDLDANGNSLDASASPPLALSMYGEKMQIQARTSSDANLTGTPPEIALGPYASAYEDPNPITRDQWYTIRFEVVFDHTGNGGLRVYRDGVELVNYTGALGYNDAVGPYLAMGVYRAMANESTAAQYRNISVTADGLSLIHI